MLRLYIPAMQEDALNVLRVKLRPDVLRHSRRERGNILAYTEKSLAERKSLELREAVGLPKQEMFLLVVEVDDDRLEAELHHQRPITGQPLARFMEPGVVVLSSVAQGLISREGSFNIQIVEPTADMYRATYPHGAPECAVGVGA